MLNIEQDVKRWTILDKISGQVFDVTDEAFNEGLQNHYIELRGQIIQVENNHKIWIDGICKK